MTSEPPTEQRGGKQHNRQTLAKTEHALSLFWSVAAIGRR